MTRYRHGPLEEAIARATRVRYGAAPEPLDVLRARVMRESRAAADEAQSAGLVSQGCVTFDHRDVVNRK